MPVILRQSGDLPPPGSYRSWLAVAGTAADLDPARRAPDLGGRLERAYDGFLGTWWELGRQLGEAPGAAYADTPTAAGNICDLGLMAAWARLVGEAAGEDETTLAVCDDPWLFRHLADLDGVEAGRPPALWPAEWKLGLRGWAARGRVALRMALFALQLGPQRRAVATGGPALLVYGHPASTAAGHDAYFGGLMGEMPELARLLHTDCPAGRARELAGDGRTAALHAWGNPLFALWLGFVRWRPRAGDLAGPWGWLVRRAAARENGGGALAMTRWQRHCQERWLKAARPGVVAWPWENHPWERLFAGAARKAGVRTVGYQHTVVGRHQTNFCVRTNVDGLDSVPDRILCNGPAFRRELAAWGVPEERLDIGGAFRIARFDGRYFDPEGPVYVALSAFAPISRQMMAVVHEAAAARPDLAFVVKDHPFYPFPVDESDRIRRTDRTIPDSPGIRAVLYGTGLTGIEGLMARVPTFRFLPEDRIALDHLPAEARPPAVTRDSLPAALDRLDPPPEVDWDRVFAPVDLERWRAALRCEAPEPPARTGAGRLWSALAWAWVLGVFGGYLYQFRHLVGPVLDKLGLS